MRLGLKISFDHFLSNLNLTEETYLLVSPCTIQKPTFFWKHKPNDIRTNAFNIYAWPLWEVNTHGQFILDPYAIITYYTFYLTKINYFVTWKMQNILDKCRCEKIGTFEWIKKLGNVFLNAQQMSIQQVVHRCLSIPLYHLTRSFQSVNMCEENNKAFFLLLQKILNKIFPNWIDIHCKSLIEKYKRRNESLNCIYLVEFVVHFGTKSLKNIK
jgi:hypothetical protein